MRFCDDIFQNNFRVTRLIFCIAAVVLSPIILYRLYDDLFVDFFNVRQPVLVREIFDRTTNSNGCIHGLCSLETMLNYVLEICLWLSSFCINQNVVN